MSKFISQLIPLEGLTRTPAEFLNRQGTEAEGETPTPWYKFQNKAAADGASSDTTEIFIYEGIGGWFGMTAVDFVEELKAVETAKIDLHLNSPGGEVFDAVAIYNSLVQHDAEVTVYIDGLAASAASFIAQAGDKVVMQKASTMMIHDASGLAWGNAADMLKTAEILNKISDNIASIYAERAGGTVADWRAFMQEEIWYTAKEAVDAGLADEVSSKRAPAAPAENKFNLAVFNFAYASREDAPSPAEIQRKVRSNMGKRAVTNDTTGSEGTADGGTEEPTAEEAAAATAAAEAAAATAAEEAATVAAEEAAAAAAAEATNRTGIVLVNGVQAADMSAVQNHINSLEMFRKETLTAGRSKFVQDLAADNKIGAPQMASLDAFAQSLPDAQYEAWTKTWDVAVSLPLFGNHAAGTSNHSGDNTTEAAKADRVEVLKGIVKQHSMAKMDASQILKTPSYNELIKLDPTFTL